MWFLLSTALAVPPDKQVANLTVGEAQLERFVVSPDGRFVTGRDAREGSENAWVLDIETWQVATLEPCRVAGVAVRTSAEVDAADLWVACSDGTLQLHVWKDGEVDPGVDDDGANIVVDVADGLTAAWYSGLTDEVLALSFAGDSGELYAFDPDTLAVDPSSPLGFSVVAGYETLSEGVVSLDGTRLIVAHGAGRVSTVEIATLSYATDVGFFLLTDPIDVTPSLNQGIYALDAEGRLAEYLPLSLQWQYFAGIEVADLDPQAIVYNPVVGDEWMVVFGERVRVWEMTNGTFPSAEPTWESGDLLNVVHDGIAHDNWVFGGGEGGGLRVITARPWVEPSTLTVEPATATDGDVVTVTFTIDESVPWELRLGGDRTGSGTLLTSGEAEAGIEQTASAIVGASWVEGSNRLYVVATDGTGLTGHGAVSVSVDNPPETPALDSGSLGFSGSALQLSFAGIPDADLDYYEVYVSTSAFTAAGYGTGGPEEEINGVAYPLTVQAEPAEDIVELLYPLDDGTEYWVAVRAVDDGGQESAMSAVVSDTPREGLNASELAGETGGGPCATGPASPGTSSGWGAFVTLAALALRRSRRGAALLARAVALSAAAAPAAAHAEDEPERWWNARDLTKAKGNFEIRYGSVSFTDQAITDVYDRGAENILAIEAGPQLWRIAEIDVGVGFVQELATTEEGGEDSVEKTMLTAWPFTLDGTLRLHLLDEQIFVPHARFGFDYLIWNEIDDLVDFTGKEKKSGAKLGTHWALGGGLLLDTLAPNRASLLEANSGINDTWLVAEWRRQAIDNRTAPWNSATSDELEFSGTSFTVGVKLDY